MPTPQEHWEQPPKQSPTPKARKRKSGDIFSYSLSDRVASEIVLPWQNAENGSQNVHNFGFSPNCILFPAWYNYIVLFHRKNREFERKGNIKC